MKDIFRILLPLRVMYACFAAYFEIGGCIEYMNEWLFQLPLRLDVSLIQVKIEVTCLKTPPPINYVLSKVDVTNSYLIRDYGNLQQPAKHSITNSCYPQWKTHET